MMMPPFVAMLADTLLVRPVDVPTPWYSVASGILSIVVTLLLLGIAIALLGMARALKGAEKNLGGRMQGLADELIPLARNLNQIATQLSEVTTEARGDLRKLSGTIGAVDDAVRDALDAGESRLHQFGTMLDAVQDEAQATVASATGIMRGVRTGAGSLVSNLFSDRPSRPSARRTARQAPSGDVPLRSDADVYARLAALEAAFAEHDDEDEGEEYTTTPPFARRAATVAETDGDGTEEWDDEDEDEDDDLDAPRAADDDDDDDDEFEDDVEDDSDDAFEDDDDDDDNDDDDDEEEDDADDAGTRDVSDTPRDPRSGGPRIRPRGRA